MTFLSTSFPCASLYLEIHQTVVYAGCIRSTLPGAKIEHTIPSQPHYDIFFDFSKAQIYKEPYLDRELDSHSFDLYK